MNKQLVKDLTQFAETVAERFSRNDREGNVSKEDFKVVEVIPMSEHAATVIYEKTTGKQAAFFFYYINRGKAKGWKYFVPTDSHILGMQSFSHYKLEVERFNYKHNF
jgi:hypothetical protein